MKVTQSFVALLALLGAAGALRAADATDGLEMTITDTYDFKMRLNNVTFHVKGDPVTGANPATLDNVPMGSGAGQAHLWVAQIAKAEFTAKEGGTVDVRAVLQGPGDEVKGTVEKAARYFFQGVSAAGEPKGRQVRIPLVEVKSVENHTQYESVVQAGQPRDLAVAMPGPNEDVLWVSSVPLGAQVFAKAFDCPAARAWPAYRSIGTTPLVCKIPAGQFAVQVRVPPALASEIKPATKLGEEASPFEHDGWGEIIFDKATNMLQAVTYTVNKTDGKAATLISLFQRKGQKLADVIETFPKGHNFHFSDKKLEGDLLYNQVPKSDIPAILEAMHRGGKVIWQGADRAFIIELKAGDRGWTLMFPYHAGAKK